MKLLWQENIFLFLTDTAPNMALRFWTLRWFMWQVLLTPYIQ
jgi:hypothetical protein